MNTNIHGFKGFHNLENGLTGLISGYNKTVHSSLSYSTGGVIYDAFKGFLVPRVDNQPQIGQNILNLLSLVKGKASINAVWNISLPQGVF